MLHPAKTMNTVKVWMAQQQSQKLPRDDYYGAFQAEFEFSAQSASAAQPANSDCGLRQSSLPNLMGSAEFEINSK